FNSSVTLLSKNDDVQAVDAQTDLEASLNAHEVVLSSLPVSGKNNVSSIVSNVRGHAKNIGANRQNAVAAFTSTDTPQVKNAALRQKQFAQVVADQTQILGAAIIDTQVASSVASITAEATSDVSAGDSESKNGHWGRAYGAYQDAIRKMKE